MPSLIGIGDDSVPVTVQARVAARPEQVFAAVVPIDLSLIFTGWGPFPGVRQTVDQTGAWDAPGQTRRPLLSDGSTAHEVLTEHTPPHSFAYEITGFTNILRMLVHGVRGEWTFTPDGSGTLIRWCYEFKARPGATRLVRTAVATPWRLYMRQALRLAARVAEQPPQHSKDHQR
ncbi:MAG: SRPBCC family protein [Janthinobacterium lividum]